MMTTALFGSTSWLKGYLPNLPTPFDEAGNIDFTVFESHCDRQIHAGATALVVGDLVGEGSTLSFMEHKAIVHSAVGAAQGRARIIAGTGSNSTNQAIVLARMAEEMGADAALSVVPYYNKPGQSGILAHFEAIAAQTGIPLILHNDLPRTGISLTVESVVRLSEKPQFIGLLDCDNNLHRLTQLKMLVRADFSLLTGNDEEAIGFLLNGGNGCASVLANIFPAICSEFYNACREGRLKSARAIASELTPLAIRFSGIDASAGLKYTLSMLGLMKPKVRLPLVELDSTEKAKIARVLKEICECDEAELTAAH